MNETAFDVYGVSIQLKTPINRFAEFVSYNYGLFNDSKLNNIDLAITFSESAGTYALQRRADLRKFSDDIYAGPNAIYWENQYGFRVLLTVRDNGKLIVHAFHHDLLGKSDSEERLKDFQRSMRWAIHFPLFTLFQYRRGWSLIHSSAVVKDGNAIVFWGLNNVGKSTLAVYMCEQYGYDIMTDNFLLVGDDTLYGFPEVIRLSPTAAKRLDLPSVWDDLVYGKYHIDPQVIGTELQAKPETFFFVNQGSELRTQRMNPATTWETVQNLHSHLGEFPEQSYLGIWPHITGKTMSTHTATKTMKTTPWYELTYVPNWNLDAMAREVMACI